MVSWPKFCTPSVNFFALLFWVSRAVQVILTVNSDKIWSFTLCLQCTCLFRTALPPCLAFSETARHEVPSDQWHMAGLQITTSYWRNCLCYAVYRTILLKLQYCYFTSFSPLVLHYLNCCTWYLKTRRLLSVWGEGIKWKRLNFWPESSKHLNAWVTLLPWVVSLKPMGPATHGGAHVCIDVGESRFCCKSSSLGLCSAVCVSSNSDNINILYMLTTLFPSIRALLACWCFFPSKIGRCSSFCLTYTPDLKRAGFQFSEKIKQINASKIQNRYFAIKHRAWKRLTRFSSGCLKKRK